MTEFLETMGMIIGVLCSAFAVLFLIGLITGRILEGSWPKN